VCVACRWAPFLAFDFGQVWAFKPQEGHANTMPNTDFDRVKAVPGAIPW